MLRFAALFLWCACAANCAVYYVSKTGSDSNNGTSLGTAWLTVSHACSTVVAGDTVHVQPGTYTDQLYLPQSGTSNARITFISDTQWGAKLVIGGINFAWYIPGSYVTIQGFDLSASDNTVYMGIIFTGHDEIVKENHVHGIFGVCDGATAGAGIDSSGANTDVIGNWVNDITWTTVKNDNCRSIHGIYLAGVGGHEYNNLVYHIAAFGLHNWHAAANITIANNLVFNCHASGILVGGVNGEGLADNFLVVNNISIDNGEYGIVEEGNVGNSNTYTDNLVVRNMLGGTDVGVPAGFGSSQPTGTITSDPAFVSYKVDGGGDYHLLSSSPAIDKGTSNGAPLYDFESMARPKGMGFDLGPYEFDSPYPGSFGSVWTIAGGLVPASPTSITTTTSSIDRMILSNTSGSAVTVTITDSSTNCNNAPCQVMPVVSIPANTVYTLTGERLVAVGGVKWSASSGTAIHAWLRGKQ